jgi:hypothetical protein
VSAHILVSSSKPITSALVISHKGNWLGAISSCGTEALLKMDNTLPNLEAPRAHLPGGTDPVPGNLASL